MTISSGNDNIITKLEITDSKVYSGRFTESHITVSTGNKSIQDSVLTVTDVNAKSVTLSATDSYYWTTNKIVVYYGEPVHSTGVTLNKNETTLTVSSSETLIATVQPDNATYKDVTWKSSDESVATVDKTGVVTAVSVGTATITATAANGTEETNDDFTATCAVTVTFEKSKLHEKITEAQSYLESDDVSGDDYSPVKKVLKDAISTANGVYENNTATDKDFESAYNTLDAALTEAKNVVAVIDEINELPAPETEEDPADVKEKINKTLADYNKLSEKAKENVTNYSKLTELKDAFSFILIGDTKYLYLQDAIDAATDNNTIKLSADIKERAAFNKDGATVTLDLNGHTIDGEQKGTVLTISNGSLILNDSSESKTGVITGGKGGNGGGVSVTGGTFTMNAGTIKDNEATSTGGGVSVTGGTFTMNDGTIEGNKASNGGGVSHSDGTFNMLGGTIQYNEGTGNTGGVLVYNKAIFSMSGGTIQYNVGKNFGGIGIDTVQPSFSGNPVVKGNVITAPASTSGMITKTDTGYTLAEGGTPCDVKRNGGLTAKIVGAMTKGAKIGIFYLNNNKTSAFTSGYNTYNADDAADKFFFSNDVTKYITKVQEGESEGELIFSEDTHDFVYTADGSIITATCNADKCGLEDKKIELTIAKPAHTEVSDGKSASAILNNLTLFKSATGLDISDSSIEYYNANGTKLDAAPTGFGTYTAKITVAEKTASVDYTIIQNCGDGVSFSYSSATKTLTISKTGEGTGVMSDYDNPEDAPWNVYKEEAEKIVIEDGVTGIGKNAFTTLTKATSATIAKSVTAIGENAFNGCEALTTVTFEPSEKDNTIQIGNGAFPEAAKPAYGEGNTKLYDNDALVNTTAALNTVNGKTLTWKNPINTTEFDAAITEANALLEKLKENAYAEIKSVLETAIATANTGINNSTTQTQADDVVTALKAAITKAQGDKTALDDKAVKDAVDKINEIGTVEYTETCKAKIDAARAAYNALTADQKAKVADDTNKPLDTLTAAETEYEALKADNEAAQAVIAKINAIGTVEYTDACKEKIDAARAAYAALTADQKAIVENDVNKPRETLEAAEAAYAALKVNNEAAKEVIDKINAIGTVEYTDECKGKIEAARAAYEILTPAQRELVTNYETLTAAEKQYKDLADKAAAQKVIDAINALPVDNITTSDKEAIEAARKAYNELSGEAKAIVDNTEGVIKKLEDAEKALADAIAKEEAAKKEAADKAAADKVVEAINKLPASDKVATTDKAAIEAARKAYDALTADQKKKVPADVLKKLTDAENALKAADKDAADKAAADKVIEAINKLPASDKVAITDKAAIEAARKAYDALTADQKKKVPADVLKKLTDAETALKAAEKDAADKAAAKKVVDAINKLPVASKVTVPNKAAIEAARKAYNSLTAEQKKKVPADVLKKLTDDEKALAAATAAEKAAKELAAAKEEAQAAMNEQVTVTQKGNKFNVKWKKSASADGYYVYAQYCGKKATKPAKTITKNTTTKTTITKINGKKISTKRNFKVFVAPYKIIDGKKVKLGESIRAKLVGTKNTKYSNVKKLTLKKSKYTVKVGKTANIKASVTLVKKNKKHLPKKYAAKFRYRTSDTGIATVDKNGKIKGIKKGTCTIYVYAINGKMKKAKVTVK